jgi:coenzyme F420 hydrogenase subunit beta
MEQGEIKTFRDLEYEVVSRDLCGKCGGCVSFCSADELNALEVGDDDLPRYSDPEKCLVCGICYMICPLTKDLDEDVQRKFGWRPPIGQYETITSARATDGAVLSAATDGGVVTALLLYLLERHLIDGAIVSRRTGTFTREPVVARSREELIAAAGSHFAGSSHLEELGDKYTTFAPVISAVKGLERRHLRHVALVGTPCQIMTVRKMQCLGILPAHMIKYTIGLFCMENFSFDAESRGKLERMLNAQFEDIDKLKIKEDVIFSMNDGKTIHLPFEEADEVARMACLACTDFANHYADISVGGLASPEGYTTVVIRSERGGEVYGEALRRGYIQEMEFATAADMSSEKTKMLAKVVAFALRKKERGETRLGELFSAGSETMPPEEGICSE